MNQKVYVFGCGKCFTNKQASVLKKYDIAAVLDNSKEGEISLRNGRTISILKIDETVRNGSIPIIIMVYEFYSIWLQLREFGIDPSRIIFPNTFSPFTEEERMFNANNGRFYIGDDNLYYEDNNKQYVIDSVKTLSSLSMLLERERTDASFLTKQASASPLNRVFGFSRGTPIDRYYIENWLESNRKLITGDVLEIAENTYTKRFAEEGAISHILHVNMEKEGFIKGDLETGDGIIENSMDCIILTQTLPFIFNVKNVFFNLHRMLRKNGCALITTGGISQISRYDMDRWGHFWSFTMASLQRLIEESEFRHNYVVNVYGNVKSACALLYGIAAEEMKKEELDYCDEDYPVSICAVLRK